MSSNPLYCDSPVAVGLASKKSNGLSSNSLSTSGMIGQSSDRTTWCSAIVYQSTISVSLMDLLAAVHSGKPGAAGVPVRVGARGVSFGRRVRRHPQVVGGECGATMRGLGVVEQRHPGGGGPQLVTDGIADPVADVRVDHPPQRRALGIDIEPGVGLDAGLVRQHLPHLFSRRVDPGLCEVYFAEAIDHHAVLRAVHVEIEAKAEEVIVIDRHGAGRDQPATGRVFPRGLRGHGLARDGLDLHDAGGAHAHFQRAGLGEDPVDHVVIVAEPDDEPDHQLGLPSRQRGVLPDLVV